MVGEDTSFYESASFEASAAATDSLEQPPANECTYEYQQESLAPEDGGTGSDEGAQEPVAPQGA